MQKARSYSTRKKPSRIETNWSHGIMSERRDKVLRPGLSIPIKCAKQSGKTEVPNKKIRRNN